MKKISIYLLLLISTNLVVDKAWATFPFTTTPVLDSGTRSNENPSSNGGQETQFGAQPMQIVSNQIVGQSGAGGFYWNPYTYKSPEIYTTLVNTLTTQNDNVSLWMDLNTATTSGYYVQYSRSTAFIDVLTINKIVSGVTTQLASINMNVYGGDSIGGSKIGPNIHLWYKPSGGQWKLILSASDTAYSSGNLALTVSYSTTSPALINFGGGNQQATPVIAPTYTCSTNYYVNKTSGASDSNNGTSATYVSGTNGPWLTVQGSITNLVAKGLNQGGTCVNVGPGTYTEAMQETNTASLGLGGANSSSKLVFRSTVAHQAIIQMPWQDADNFYSDFSFAGTPGGTLAQYIVVDGFDLEGAAGTYITLSSPGSATVGAVYKDPANNLFTVQATIASASLLWTIANGVAYSTSCPCTLTKISGTGNSTLSYSFVSPGNDTGVSTPGTNNYYQLAHIDVINNILNGFGGAGIGMNHADYLFAEGNLVTNNASTNFPAQSSGISTYQPWAHDLVAGYHNTIAFNILSGNGEGVSIPYPHSDGNDIIIDDARDTQNRGTGAEIDTTAVAGGLTACVPHSGSPGTGWSTPGSIMIIPGGTGGQCVLTALSGSSPSTYVVFTAGSGYSSALAVVPTFNYPSKTLVENNLTSNTGGGSIHAFSSDNLTAINNTTYNGYTDILNSGTSRSMIDASSSSNDVFVNNIAVALVGTSTAADTTACGDYSFGTQNTGNVWYNNECSFNFFGGNPTYILNTTATIANSSPYYNIIGAPPVFASISEGDFTLDASYPGKGAGTNLEGLSSTDMIGQTVNTQQPTLGAYQFIQSDQVGTDYN